MPDASFLIVYGGSWEFSMDFAEYRFSHGGQYGVIFRMVTCTSSWSFICAINSVDSLPALIPFLVPDGIYRYQGKFKNNIVPDGDSLNVTFQKMRISIISANFTSEI
jgi:hypothetical protein